jgi:Fibronectin type III domain
MEVLIALLLVVKLLNCSGSCVIYPVGDWTIKENTAKFVWNHNDDASCDSFEIEVVLETNPCDYSDKTLKSTICQTHRKEEVTSKSIYFTGLAYCQDYNYNISGVKLAEMKSLGSLITHDLERSVIEVNQTSDSSFELSWDENATGCDNSYRLEISTDEGEKIPQPKNYTMENKRQFDQRQTCVGYNVRLFTMRPGGQELNTNMTFKLWPNETSLSSLKVYDLKVELESDTSMTVSWSPPKLYEKCVEGYEVELNSIVGQRSIRAKETQIKFPGLFACVNYTVEVLVVPVEGSIQSGDKESIRAPARGENSEIFSNRIIHQQTFSQPLKRLRHPSS